ncbi:MAG TPA: hypothetical protein VJ111_11735 [Chitinophagaceae bacterium]|nr:hypothetical protein [Chitinophagaceae bacterium]
MKNIFLVITLLASCTLFSQQTDSIGKALSAKISVKMKDSLNLSEKQQAAIYEINKQLSDKSMMVWKQYGQRDSVQRFLQRIENTRDSLYKTVLPNEKYWLYREKKSSLVNNNN